jgi:uncharacterized protein
MENEGDSTMPTLEEAAQEFLAQKRIAVAGVSRKGDVAANFIYKKLRSTGYEVFPVNPNAEEVEGDRCYPNLAAIDGGVDAVVVATHPDAAPDIVRQCGEVGVRRVWIHRGIGKGSYNEEAVRLCRELGIGVIPGSCPIMFCEPVDIGHKCFRWFFRVTGNEPAPHNAGT